MVYLQDKRMHNSELAKKNIEKDSYRRTNRLISERLPDGKISVDWDPHERVYWDGPEGDLHEACQPTHQVAEHPTPCYGRVHR